MGTPKRNSINKYLTCTAIVFSVAGDSNYRESNLNIEAFTLASEVSERQFHIEHWNITILTLEIMILEEPISTASV